ncbi:unnamed protein product [Plutella xylostella]|uniref:(diamondback moth) hypothetical protein n=1 Tax=Plutella xylostella TaxID=51655 RepID=A0A8S4G1Q1_PLUXY|nr:unnamed protein product [Plutella xylostella]
MCRPPLASALVEIALGGKSGRIEAVQTTPGLLPRLVALLEHRSAAVKTPALRAVGNMLTGSDVQVWRLERLEEIAFCDKYTSTSALVEIALGGKSGRIEAVQTTPGLLPRLVALLEHRSAAVKTPALRAVGNMLTGSDVQRSPFAIRPPSASALVEIALGGKSGRIEAVQTTPGLLPRLVALLEHRSAAVKTPALRAVGNMLTGSDVQVWRLERLEERAFCDKLTFGVLTSALVEIALGGKSGRIEAVQTTPGLLPRLVALLEHRSAAVKTPALRAVGNMLTGSDVQVWRLERLEEIAFCDKYTSIRPPFVSKLEESLFAIRPPSASALREIALGGKSGRIEAVQTTPGLLPRLVALLEHRSAAVKTPALRAVGNMLTGSDVQIALGGKSGRIEAVQTTPGLLPRLVALLEHRSAADKTPALLSHNSERH